MKVFEQKLNERRILRLRGLVSNPKNGGTFVGWVGQKSKEDGTQFMRLKSGEGGHDYSWGGSDEEGSELDDEDDIRNTSSYAETSAAVLTSRGRDLVKADHHVAVLVSDLSGFTSTTRKHGIIHFASIIVRMRQLCLPILHNRGLVHLTTEADNFIVVFEDTVQATMVSARPVAILCDPGPACPRAS